MDVLLSLARVAGMCLPTRCLAMVIHVTICIYNPTRPIKYILRRHAYYTSELPGSKIGLLTATFTQFRTDGVMLLCIEVCKQKS
jgi:hypothetical protein